MVYVMHILQCVARGPMSIIIINFTASASIIACNTNHLRLLQESNVCSVPFDDVGGFCENCI